MLQRGDRTQGRAPLRRQADEVPRGSHASFAYSSADELRPVVARFVASALEHGDRCLYILGDRTIIELVDWLDATGIDVPKHAADGSLQIMRAQQVYLRSGVFDPHAVRDTVRAAVRRALADGYPGLQAAGDMSWAVTNASTATLVEYERSLDRTLFTDGRLTGLCLYDDRRFGWEAMAALAAAHSLVLRPAREVRA